MVMALSSGVAGAGDLCGEINKAVKRATGEIGEVRTWRPRKVNGAHHCVLATTLSGVKTYYCTWRFAYRAHGAVVTYARLLHTVRACLAGRGRESRDQGVNHPDTYAQRRFQIGRAAVMLASKDKSVLASTYVFLRIEVAAP